MACVRDNKAGGLLGKKVSPRLMPPSEGGEKEYKLEELFQSSNGDYDIQKTHLNGKGEAVVSSGESNNGVVGKTDIPARVFSANTITVDMFGNSYYQVQPYKMVTHARVFSLSPINEMRLSEKIGLYVLAKIRYFKKLFSYNNMCSWEKIRKLSIVLPLNKYGNIDFSYIEERVRELEEERVRELEAYLCAAGFSDCSLTLAEREALNKFMGGVVRNKSFEIPSIFHIANTHNILKSDVVFNSGTIPYVTASANNNSVVSYISYKNELIERGNSIMIGGKTLVITYQPMDFFSNDSHNLVLRIKDKGGQSESCALFAVTALYKSLLPKYSWGDSISKQKIQNDKVYLPVTDNGSIDYSFMETYISAVKKQVIGRLKDFIAHEKDVYLRAIS